MKQIHGIRLKPNSPIARIAAWKLGVDSVAVTVGRTIHLHNACQLEFLADSRWLRHELAHVEQFRRYGFLRFIGLYILESMRKGYYQNRFEVEAREAEGDQVR